MAPQELQHAEYRQVGKSGLKVSVPVLGMMGMGNSKWMPWVLDDDQALPILKAAYDRGINTWDTANVYSNGESERIMGHAMRNYDIPRHKLVLMTKIYGYLQEDPNVRGSGLIPATVPKNMGATYGLSRSAIINAVNASLERIGTDYIDLLQIHRFDKTVQMEETMQTLHELVQSGKVRYIGASSMWTYQFAQMQFIAEKNGWTKFVSMQNYYNLLYREEEREMNKFCDETGVGRFAWAALGRGMLARPIEANSSARSVINVAELTEQDREIIGHVVQVAKKREWPMSHVTLAWINQRVTSPICGIGSVERMDELLGATGKFLTAEETALIENPYTPKRVKGHM